VSSTPIMEDRRSHGDYGSSSIVFAGKHDDKPCIECVNLATSLQKGPISKIQSGLSNELCDICSKIDFGKFFGDSQHWCACDKQHYHLGAMEDIRMKRGCTMCRLLSSIYDSVFSPVSDTTLLHSLTYRRLLGWYQSLLCPGRGSQVGCERRVCLNYSASCRRYRVPTREQEVRINIRWPTIRRASCSVDQV
jgi:hypothetical protein